MAIWHISWRFIQRRSTTMSWKAALLSSSFPHLKDWTALLQPPDLYVTSLHLICLFSFLILSTSTHSFLFICFYQSSSATSSFNKQICGRTSLWFRSFIRNLCDILRRIKCISLFLLDLNMISNFLLQYLSLHQFHANVMVMVMVTGHEDGQYHVHISWCYQTDAEQHQVYKQISTWDVYRMHSGWLEASGAQSFTGGKCTRNSRCFNWLLSSHFSATSNTAS